jgi:pyruvate kinase
MSTSESIASRPRTKTVVTVGPACQELSMLRKLVEEGADVFRLNMAHGTQEEHLQTLSYIREIEASTGRPFAVLVDLAGPKIRLGELNEDPLVCRLGDQFTFVRGESGVPGQLTCTYSRLIDELDVGDRVLLSDGTVEFVVVSTSEKDATCRVVQPGEIRSRQGINLPGVRLSTPAMSDTDRENARWAARNGADYVSLSFVRSAEDVQQLKSLLEQENSSASTIAKIEKPEALGELDAIVQAADGIMVARGDLGVEIDVADMPVEQKRIIDVCARWERPVIVATQMLDSMQRSSRPTRAEVTDVANAILDGTDACMLSGETAIGKYPCESVRMMNRIMRSTEAMMGRQRRKAQTTDAAQNHVHPVTSAVVRGAGRIAADLYAKLVVIATRSGATALTKAKQRDFIPTVAVTDCESTLRRMCLFWGINPVPGAPANMDRDLLKFIDRWATDSGGLQHGDRVVVVTGTGVKPGAHNLLVVHEIEPA